MSLRIIRQFQQDDIARISTLADSVYGTDALGNAAYVEWKYVKNPYGSIACTYEINDELIGVLALTALPLKVQDSSRVAAVSGDLMVHSKFRRQGIFISMLSYLFDQKTEHVSLAYADRSLKSATVRGVVKYSLMKHVGDIPVLLRYLRPLSAMRALWVFYGRLTLRNVVRYLGYLVHVILITLLGKLTAIVGPQWNARTLPSDEKKLKVSEMEDLAFGDEFTSLWQEVGGSYPIAVIRNSEYLNWRYASHPTNFYVGFRAVQDGVLRGYAVLLYTTRGNLKTAWVVDIFASGPDVEAELVKCCMRRALRDHAHVFTMFKTKRNRDFSKRLGLISGWPIRNPLLVRNLSNQISEDFVCDPSNWYLTIADIEDWA
jgi:hypothetical protein